MADLYLVFVHGWSVYDLSTYGQLPIRLRTECANRGINLNVQEIWLGQYISFHDEVRLPDISRAFQAAVIRQLDTFIKAGNRFICITHSTGAPVIRDWWDRYYRTSGQPCPMSHLIMLAPANFGSALAQLGKSKLSRLVSLLEQVQPGQGVLDWLELGSEESWDLNSTWIRLPALPEGPAAFYPFALIGQSIDRHFYDQLNPYTGEIGSDGVVRSAAANLNATLITVRQAYSLQPDGSITDQPPVIGYITAPPTAFRILPNRSHSGTTMGIITSVTQDPATDTGNQPTVDAILQCIRVANDTDYANLTGTFNAETIALQQAEKVETVPSGPFALFTRHFIHDRFVMVIFRVRDSEGYPLIDYQLRFTGPGNNPNFLPPGFFADRQQNHLDNETVTYFVNYDMIVGCDPVPNPGGGADLRPRQQGITQLGLEIIPNPGDGFVRYAPLQLEANEEFFQKIVKPNATILIDITIQRLVSNNVFLHKGPVNAMPTGEDANFRDLGAGTGILPSLP